MNRAWVIATIFLLSVCMAADEKDVSGATATESPSFNESMQLAQQGNPDAEVRIALAYFLGEEVAKDDRESTIWMRKAAEHGMAEAQHLMGAAYAEGIGVEQDYTEAMSWYRMAADQSFGKAQVAIADLYGYGLGVDRDLAEAVRWMRKAAKQGLAEAQRRLAMAYDAGSGVTQSHKRAAKWFRAAAEQGDFVSQTRLAVLYALGEGVRRDPEMAESLARQAAEEGLADAQHLLGMLYDEGIGTKIDYEEAVRWYRMAANQGHVRAKTDMGLMYSKGLGVEEDLVEALKWFYLAIASGDQQAFEQGILTASLLTPEERDKAEELALDWLEAHEKQEPSPEQELERPAEARILASGICEAKGEETKYAVPDSPSQTASNFSDLVITDTTNTIPLEKGTLFGFSWLVTGLPEVVNVTYYLEHPVMTGPDGIQRTTTKESMVFTTRNGTLESTDCYGFDHDYELVAGEWTYSILFDGSPLLKQSYEVVPID